MIPGTIELLQLFSELWGVSVSKDDSNSHIPHEFNNLGPYKLQKYVEKWKYILQTVDTCPPILTLSAQESHVAEFQLVW